MVTQPETREPPKLLTVPEAARLLSIGERTLWRKSRQGTILAVRVGRRVLIPRAEVDRIARGG